MKINTLMYRCRFCLGIACSLFVLPLQSIAQSSPTIGGPDEPVRVLSPAIDLSVHDGRLRPAIGTENIQVLRANRTRRELADNMGWTYNHAPMLAYWNNKFYLEYLSNPIGEHLPPGHTMVATSKDGRTWDMPKEVFPMYMVRPGPIASIESGIAMMHQRQGFYTAPNGRLLVLAVYGHAPAMFGAAQIGRVVREAYKDGTYGPIYFIRTNAAAKKEDIHTYAMYNTSADKGFVEACEALLANKLKTMEWWDEDRPAKPDGFHTVTGHEAPSVYHRRDGLAVAHWKSAFTAVSSDEGMTWSKPFKVPGITTDGAKTWGQKTEDGMYSLVYNPANFGSHRWPLAVVSGTDGITFDNMLLVDGEVPPRRFIGRAKDFGLQYVRGISEGDGNPPGSDMWLTYSGNKEDMWVSRVPVPIRYKVEGPVSDKFNELVVGAQVPDWNLYRPKWAPVSVVAFPGAANKSLQLEDKDPYNYAKAVRVFAEAKTAHVSFKLYARQANKGTLEMEVLDQVGHRPVRVVLADNGHIQIANGSNMVDAGLYKSSTWYTIDIAVNATSGKYDVSVNGKQVIKQADFAEPATTVERLSFRTGVYRTELNRQSDRYAGGDLPNADDAVPAAVFNIDDVTVK